MRKLLSIAIALGCSGAGLAQSATRFDTGPRPVPNAAVLPEAPRPVASESEASEPDPPTGGARSKYKKELSPNEPHAPLSTKEKFKLSVLEQARPFAFASEILSAGWEHALNTDPLYGTDSAAFGERLGAAALKQTSQAILTDGLFASIFRQDPRYYRAGSGPFFHRVEYAVKRTWITSTDSGTSQANYSLFAGYAAATALSATYYPGPSVKAGRMTRGYVLSIAVNMLGNQYREFWPDVSSKLFHRH